ncbi:DNA starvation/stationary phase protection protein [Pseudonocardia zijingensis]|jgi:starvation-inducible DNA-binding protein|uniref:DNA starvation/stationary phase protection protein n=1 Tax=Pseudonocardia zijingensis TaxID=153376 RepID=A0ABP3YYV5_9PSEU
MDSLTAAVYLPPLDNPHERAAIGHELAAVLHDLVALSLTGKQLHWMAAGPLSHSLHLQLDELVDSWRAMADTVAERAVTIGHTVDGQPAAVAAGTGLTPIAPDEVQDNLLVHEVTHRVATVAERVRARLRRVGEVDLVSQDVLIGVTRELEKQQWQLRVQSGAHR